ncbi:hypothetical protein BDQ17DRAFT_1383357 [Cyathus striatus]|nr:hypothetical protein BDQ17DRAFT_1383357 [Cyathus striatus]
MLQNLVDGMDNDSDSGSEGGRERETRREMEMERGGEVGVRIRCFLLESLEAILRLKMRTVHQPNTLPPLSHPHNLPSQHMQHSLRHHRISPHRHSKRAIGRVVCINTTSSQGEWGGAADIYDDYRYSRFSMASRMLRFSMASGFGRAAGG